MKIFASGGLDAYLVGRLARESPIDGFGVGTNLVTSQDAPGLDCACKLQEYAGRARRKRGLETARTFTMHVAGCVRRLAEEVDAYELAQSPGQ